MQKMTFEEKLKRCPPAEVWQEYCGFLSLSLPEYMDIQKRLLMEQVQLMSGCALGQRFFKGNTPSTVEEFRARVPLTRFEDYADVLLPQREDMLPAKPVVWLHTTWEGGDFPSKRAPYTESMLETYKTNILAAMLLSTSRGPGHFHVRPGCRVLYSLAPMPYATGMFPDLISSEIHLRFMPSVREARKMSFGQQMRTGYKQAAKYGMNLFFGMSSVLYGATRSLNMLGGEKSYGLKSLLGMSPRMLYRILAAKYRSRRDGAALKPRDLFKLDGFVCVGTDTALYKNELEEAWGIRPLEIAGGTERVPDECRTDAGALPFGQDADRAEAQHRNAVPSLAADFRTGVGNMPDQPAILFGDKIQRRDKIRMAAQLVQDQMLRAAGGKVVPEGLPGQLLCFPVIGRGFQTYRHKRLLLISCFFRTPAAALRAAGFHRR